MKIEQVTNLVEKIYWEVLDKLGAHEECVQEATEKEHTELGKDLYDSIETIIKKHLEEHFNDDRDKMTDSLVNSMVETLKNDQEFRLLVSMEGFKGFNNFTIAELKNEYNNYLKDKNDIVS
jgi:hypothetical protein